MQSFICKNNLFQTERLEDPRLVVEVLQGRTVNLLGQQKILVRTTSCDCDAVFVFSQYVFEELISVISNGIEAQMNEFRRCSEDVDYLQQSRVDKYGSVLIEQMILSILRAKCEMCEAMMALDQG